VHRAARGGGGPLKESRLEAGGLDLAYHFLAVLEWDNSLAK
jgi:hypothetical protein